MGELGRQVRVLGPQKSYLGEHWNLGVGNCFFKIADRGLVGIEHLDGVWNILIVRSLRDEGEFIT